MDNFINFVKKKKRFLLLDSFAIAIFARKISKNQVKELNLKLDTIILFLFLKDRNGLRMEDCIEPIHRDGVAKEERSIISRARSASSISNIRSSRRTECRPRSVRCILSMAFPFKGKVGGKFADCGAERHKRFDLNFIPAIMDVDFSPWRFDSIRVHCASPSPQRFSRFRLMARNWKDGEDFFFPPLFFHFKYSK